MKRSFQDYKESQNDGDPDFEALYGIGGQTKITSPIRVKPQRGIQSTATKKSKTKNRRQSKRKWRKRRRKKKSYRKIRKRCLKDKTCRTRNKFGGLKRRKNGKISKVALSN